MKGMVDMKNRPAPLIIALILIIAGFGIPIMTRVYWVIPPVLTALIILGAIILLVVLQRRRTAEKAGISEELCSDIHSVLFSSGGRNFVIRQIDIFQFFVTIQINLAQIAILHLKIC